MRIDLFIFGLALSSCASTAPAPADRSATEPERAELCSVAAARDPSWYDRAVGYEIFVRSFQDSDGDGIGDLEGLRQRLDFLNDGDPHTTTDLGVTLLWLMPIFDSPSYHGYDTSDYLRINPDYGTQDDLTRLIASAHERGIRIIVDLVLNHASNRHPYFVQSAAHPEGPFGNYFVWRGTDPGWGQPWNPDGSTWHRKKRGYYYGLFTREMPDWNWSHEPVSAYLTSVATHWLDLGLDGFRLDAVRYLEETGGGAGQADTPATHARWQAFRSAIDGASSEALLLGEAWADAPTTATYAGPASSPELHMTFDFASSEGTLAALKSGLAAPLAEHWCASWRERAAHARAATFLTNHDMSRVASQLADRHPRALRLAAALLLLGPGTPWMYYGESMGLANADMPGDARYRQPMPWSDAPGHGFTSGEPWATVAALPPGGPFERQAADDSSLTSLYRRLIRLRESHPALQVGNAALVPTTPPTPHTVTLCRQADEDRYAVVFNLGSEPVQAAPGRPPGWPARPYRLLFGDEGPRSGDSAELPPHSFRVYALGAGWQGDRDRDTTRP